MARREKGKAATRSGTPWLQRPGWLGWRPALALFLLVAGARWWLIGAFSSDVPWLDQWDGEAQGTYLLAHAGTLTLSNWFAPHNEHRIFFTRLLSLGLLKANGQWDPRLEMVVDAGLFGAIAAGLFLALRKARTLGFQLLCWVVLAALGCAPYGSTNILLGFQSQFYFLAGFSLISMYGLLNCRPGSAGWIAGVLCGCAALVSMASGYAAAVAVLGVLAISAARSAQGRLITAVAAGALIAAGLTLRYTPPQHAALAAHGIGDFVGFLVACLSWPGKPFAPLAVLTWAPLAIFLALYVRGRAKDGPQERFVLAIGGWALLQAGGLALFRANSGEGLESRYMELLAFGILANAICVIWLFDAAGGWRKAVPVLAIVWFAAIGIGLYGVSFDDSGPQWKQNMESRRAATAGFVATGDRRYLDTAPPYHTPDVLAALLQNEWLRSILPVNVRSPLALAPDVGSPEPRFNELSSPNPSELTSDVWTWPALFSRFATIPPSTRFQYRIEKKSPLPLLLVYMIGQHADLEVEDSNHTVHRMITLPGGGQGSHGVVSCPTAQCVVKGASGTAQFAIAEPKEIGVLSVAALLAAEWGQYVFAAGALLFLASVLAPIRRRATEAS